MNNSRNQSDSQFSDNIPIPLDPPMLSHEQTESNLAGSSSQAASLRETDEIPFELEKPGIASQQTPSQETDEPPLELDRDLPPTRQTGGSSSQPIIRMEHISKKGGVRLNDVSLELFTEQLACIMGGSQEGASSLLRVLALEEEVTSGQVLIENQDAFKLNAKDRNVLLNKYIAYIRQIQLDLSGQTVRRHLAYWLHYYEDIKWDKAKETALEALNNVNFPQNRWDVPTQELSSEEIARVSVAKICVEGNCNRSIYLLDDVFTALNPYEDHIAIELLKQLREVAKRGKAIVVLANRQDLSASFDHILVMQSGQVIRDNGNS